MSRFLIPLATVAVVLLGLIGERKPRDGTMLTLHLRSRVQPFKSDPAWRATELTEQVAAAKSAIVICDTWDNHWCKAAARRCGELAKKMAPVVESARSAGVTIVHAPSDCMAFYDGSPARKRARAVPRVAPPKLLDLPDPPCPVDASDGGCDDPSPDKEHRAWTRENAAIPIDEEHDYVSDNGDEVYSILKERGITTLFVMGVHTNMCVLHRTFAIEPMTRRGVRCVLVRDLTDAMYNPARPPHVSHAEGTGLIIEFIEKNWCPTILSSDLTGQR